MRTEPPYKVIIADRHRDRAGGISEVLNDIYRTDPTIVRGWDILIAELVDLEGKNQELDLLILAHGLPGMAESLQRSVSALRQTLVIKGSIIPVLEHEGVNFDPRDNRTHPVVSPNQQIDQDQLKKVLKLCLPSPLPLPQIKFPKPPDRILIEQVKSLDSKGRLNAGKLILSRMVGNIMGKGKASVKRLTQGYSGAQVLRVDWKSGHEPKSFAMKISPARDRWKIENELSHWNSIEKALAPYGLMRYLSILKKPEGHDEEPPKLVTSSGWDAIAYLFLGDNIGHFLDFKHAYMQEEQLAWELLNKLISILRFAWYDGAKASKRKLWGDRDAQYGKVLTFPPYCFTAWQKAHILGAMEQLEPYGKRLLPQWQGSVQTISAWMKSESKILKLFSQPDLVVVSPVHGDLNSNNFLLWVDKDQPFLIDFACYQKAGHTLQDFARLEAEVKFELMDREAISPLPALDLTFQQLAIWCQLEDQFTSPNWNQLFSTARGDTKYVSHALSMITYIRTQAKEVHDNVFGTDATFERQYRSALLYHSLRAIGYESLSILKRILAVYSAARLILTLGIGTD